MDERRVTLCGLSTRYVTAGSGRPMVFLHALGEDSSQWLAVLRALSPRYRLYALDLPGFAGGPRLPRYSAAWFASFVAAFVEDVAGEEVAVVGNSLGGLIALRLALEHREQVAALGLVSSVGLGVEVSTFLQLPTLPGLGEVAVLLAKTPPGMAHRVLGGAALLFGDARRVPCTWFARQVTLTHRPGFLEGVLAGLRAQVDLHGQRDVVVDELPRLDMPTIVVWGDCDRVVPIAHAHRAAARLPQVSLTRLAGCGHLPPVEQPQRLAVALKNFLERSFPP